MPHYLEASPSCTQPVAKVVSVQGKVDRQYPGHSEWQSIQTDDSVCPGDKIRTEKWSRATLMLSNESLVTLDQSTTLVFSEPEENAPTWLLRLIGGSAFFRSRQPQRLNIQTPFINAVHKGTEFLVTVDDQQTKISVFDGQVAAENKAGRIQIKKGFSGIAQKNRPPRLQALTITPEDAVQWTLYYPPIIDYQLQKSSISAPNLKSALAAYQQGDVYQALAKLDEVPVTYQDSEYLTLKASLLLTVGRVDEALTSLNRALRIRHDHSIVYALQSIIAVAKNQQQTALDLALKAETLNPGSSVAKIALSYAYQSLFKIKEAMIATQKATQLAPNNALAWSRLSELQLSMGDHDGALVSAQKAQNLNPKLARTQTILGFADLAQVDIDAAKKAFEQAIALDSSYPLARLGLGLAKIRKGALEEGTRDIETAVNLDPDNALTRSYLGKAYYELRNKDYASTEFKIAKEMDPKDPTSWFYDAILKQTTNRPVEALYDMQKAIELNDNRGVYRSKLLLDKDVAAREAGLGRIYNSVGFDDVANRLASKSLATDPSNYSAHRLLSDSYATRPRHEIARTSEHLQSQLLQPLNYNPIQPSLAYADLNIIKGVGPAITAFNEYNRLFEGNGLRFTTTGIYGSNNTLGDETALSGIYNKLSYSFGQLHYDTDGFRKNNDLKHNLYNVFSQYEVSQALNVQAEYRHRETEHGDLELKGEADNFDETYRRQLDQDTYRLGFKFSPAQQSDFLFSFIHANRGEITNQGNSNAQLYTKTNSYDVETQYLFHNDYINTIAGGGMYRTENDTLDKFSDCDNNFCGPSGYNTTQYFGYLYSNFKFFNNLNLTAGLSFDQYRDNQIGAEAKINELNPKFGFLWQANQYFTIRAAAFKSVKSAIVDNQILQPAQIAGFNQFFDDFNGTVVWQYGVGMDTHFHKNLYTGIEAYKRDLKIPYNIDYYEKTREELYRLYFNWAPMNNIAINSEFRFENFRYGGEFLFPNVVQTAYIPLTIRFFYPVGFFAELKGTYVNQKVRSIDFYGGDFISNFYLVDAAIGYRFPKQYGLISFEATNLFDTNFKYRDRQFQMNEQRSPDFMPERMLFARITFNF